MKDYKRNYQNKNEKQEVYNYEIANELGAQLERDKNMHQKEYQKNSSKMNSNQSKHKNPYNNR